jgi:hypothetical protein
MLRKLAVVMLVMSVAGAAVAVDMPGGHVRIKMEDFTSLYANGRALPDAALTPPQMSGTVDENNDALAIWAATLQGAELRTIVHATTAGGVDSTDVLHGTWNESAAEELTGTLTGVQVAAASAQYVDLGISRFVALTLVYAPMNRPTDVDGTGQMLGAGDSYGGRITLYSDSTPDFDNSFGPNAWVAGTVDGDPNGTRLEYPGASRLDINGLPDAGVEIFMDGTLVDFGYFTDNGTPSGVVLQGTLFYELNSNDIATQATGTAEALINSIRNGAMTFGADSQSQEYTTLSDGVVAENWAGQQVQWSSIPNALWGDAHMLTNLTWGHSPGGWNFSSQDPVDYYRVPEPTTMALLGLGLLGVIRRRRNKKA